MERAKGLRYCSVLAPLVLELTGKPTPVTGLEGKFSVFHSAAVALIDGNCASRRPRSGNYSSKTRHCATN